MKLLFVINTLGVGGAEKSLISLLDLIDYERYEIDLLMFQKGGLFLEMLPEKVNVLPELPFMVSNRVSVGQVKNSKYLKARLAASVGLRKNAKKHELHDAQCYWKYAGDAFDELPDEYDVAIAWGQGNPTHYVASKVKANRKLSVINADYEKVGHNKVFDVPYYSKYDKILCVSDKLTEEIKNVFPMYKERIETLYDINNAKMINRMAKLENPICKSEGEYSIVTVARLVEVKNHRLLVETAKELVNRGIKFKWYVVGDGPERKNIEKWIEEMKLTDRIVMVGATSNPYVYTGNCDVYVQTSRAEGFCLTLTEARILNRPVVSTNFETVYNQLTDGVNSLITEMNSISLANAVERILADKILYDLIIENIKCEKKGNEEEIERFYGFLQ